MCYTTIHWFQGTFDLSELQKVRSAFSHYFDPDYNSGPGRWLYEKQYRFAFGVSIQYDESPEAIAKHAGRACLVIPGQACDILGHEKLWELLHYLRKRSVRCTRLDLAFDDYQKLVHPHHIVSQVKAREMSFAPFRKMNSNQVEDHRGVLKEDTVYFGSRGENGTGSFVRCYNKSLESKGRIDCIRWEYELTSDKAAVVFQSIIRSEAFPHALIGAYIGGALRFIVEGGGTPWWWTLLTIEMGQAAIALEPKEVAVEKTAQWVEHSVTGALKFLGCAMSGKNPSKDECKRHVFAFLESLWDGKPFYLRKEQRMAISVYREEKYND